MHFKKELNTKHTAAVRFSVSAGMKYEQTLRANDAYAQAAAYIAKDAQVDTSHFAVHRRRDRAIYIYLVFTSSESLQAAEAALGRFIEHLNNFPHWYQAEEE